MYGTQVLKTLKAVYGLRDAPRECYMTVDQHQIENDWKPLLLEPCFWCMYDKEKLVGICIARVDDFLISGDENDRVLQNGIC